MIDDVSFQIHVPKLSDFLLVMHQSLAHQGHAKSLDISIGMPAIFANLATSKSRHISSQKIAQLRYYLGDLRGRLVGCWGNVVDLRDKAMTVVGGRAKLTA